MVSMPNKPLGMNPRWNYAKLLKELEKWLADDSNRQRLLERPSAILKEYNGGRPLPTASNLRWIFSWRLCQGVVDLAHGHSEATAELASASRYQYWRIKALAASFGTSGEASHPVVLLNEVSLHFGLSLALGLMEDADVSGGILARSLDQGMFFPDDTNRLAPFMIRLFCDWKGIEPPRSLNRLADPEGYRPLLEHWREADSDQLQTAISSACDFHTWRSGDSNKRETFEFSDPVFRIFPVEILSVLRLREGAGLLTTLPPHALLEYPTGKLYPKVQTPRDEFLESVVEKLKKDLPQFS